MQTTNQQPLHLTVLTPTRRLLEGVGCGAVYFPSSQGVLGILPEHTDLVCALGTGIVYYNSGNVTSFLTISGGVAQVNGSSVTLLADIAEDAASIDVGRAQRALERAREMLTGKSDPQTPAEVHEAVSAEARALARIEAATLHSTGR
ncbi:ATP synthase F1 subunit epsilon [bacterium]|nr:ATP synthase F1 subunit epsilon [bacterium]